MPPATPHQTRATSETTSRHCTLFYSIGRRSVGLSESFHNTMAHGPLARVARRLSCQFALVESAAAASTSSTRAGAQVHFARIGCLNQGKQSECPRCFSTKRRRRRGSAVGLTPDPDPADRNEVKSRLSPAEFERVASTLLDRFEMAVTKLKDSNEGLEITRYPASGGSDAVEQASLSIKVASTGDMYWAGGTYWLSIDGRAGIVRLQSPLSGNFTYNYDPLSREWVGTEDGHRLTGMFTRDWIRQNNGVPDL